MTDAERRLWSKLRNSQLNGEKFRRQHPLGPYVLDFFCERTNLAVEVDGGQHAEQAEADLARTRWLESKGCRVIRFWNNEVLSNTEEVLEAIRLALNASPHPTLSPRERE
jgi:very-short-patch-repair endonuclease